MLALAGALAAGPVHGQDREPRGRAVGGLSWVFSDDVDLIGTMTAEVPLAESSRGALFGRFELHTAIDRSLGEFTFAVRGIDYRAELAARSAEGLELFVGRRGLERVDAPGEPSVVYAGAGWTSRGYDRAAPARTWEGQVSSALPLHRAADAAKGVVRGAVRFTRPRTGWAWGFDARAEAWPAASRLRADLEAGPRLDLPWRGGRALSLKVAWLRSRSPFGTGADGLTAGFEIVEGPWPAGERVAPPDVRGVVAFGTGDDGRHSGRLRVAVISPPWGNDYRARLDVDANVLTARDTGELFYLYHAGLERGWAGVVGGVWFHHRSNHVLAEENPIGVTSRNVVEISVETPGWEEIPRPVAARWGRFDGSVRPGWVVDSAFDETPGPTVRGGARWTFPAGADLAPYLLVEGTTGDAESRLYALGLALPKPLDLRVAFTADRQHFSRDRTAWIASVGFPF